MPEARGWMDAILATGIEVSDRTRAIALGFSAWVSLWQERGRARTRALRGERPALPRGRRLAAARRSRSARSHSRTSERSRPISTVRRRSGRASLAIVEGRAPTVESMAKVTIGRVMVRARRPETAVELFDEALAQADAEGDMFAATLALTNRAWAAARLRRAASGALRAESPARHAAGQRRRRRLRVRGHDRDRRCAGRPASAPAC